MNPFAKSNFNWDATGFFHRLITKNRLATAKRFMFMRVSGLEGFEEALGKFQNCGAYFCVSDVAPGVMELNNTPRTRRVKTVYLAMRHKIDDMAARQACMDAMRELFRQLMSVLVLERTRLQERRIFIDPEIAFNEIDRYFFSGCACCYFQIAVEVFTDLRYDEQEWYAVVPMSCDTPSGNGTGN